MEQYNNVPMSGMPQWQAQQPDTSDAMPQRQAQQSAVSGTAPQAQAQQPVTYSFTPQQSSQMQPYIQNQQQSLMEGTLQERLSLILGRYVICEFLIGTQMLYTREGILTQVGRDYFILYDPETHSFVGCDAYALKFITVFPAGQRPEHMDEEQREEYVRMLKKRQHDRIYYATTYQPSAAGGGTGDKVPVLLLSEDQLYMG